MESSVLLQKIKKWAKNNNNIVAVLLVGSYARGEARMDSDIDLVFICNTPTDLLKNVSWIKCFGEVVKYNIEDWGIVHSIRTFYKSGEEIEFGITSREWAALPVDTGTKEVVSGGAKIILDKEGILKLLLCNCFPGIMDYNSRYSKKEFYWGMEPNDLVVDSIKYLTSGSKVLDLGCGEGKNSFFLAKNGFDVTAVDISESGIKKLKEFAKKEKLKIKADVSDIRSCLNDCGEFDVIFGINVFQFIDQKNIFSIIDRIKSKTKPGGINVIASFIAKTSKQKKIVLSKGRYYFNKEELKELYKDWKILFYEEKLGNWETHGELRHRHFTVRLIAQKI